MVNNSSSPEVERIPANGVSAMRLLVVPARRGSQRSDRPEPSHRSVVVADADS